ncbi:hypothetical protein [uncultured Oxalicibacterium sp.]|uniref:hypothetical protein n=1 Tax=uncultured Oxalicibacterium sp. TaxID=1168540 RepID=UPI0025E5C826|nr:hypothetical protein [uncultured Oxalicibacterium sp.]
MSRVPETTYEGFAIYTFVMPADQGGWSAVSDVERHAADGVEVFQDFGGPCDADTAEQAKAAVLADTRHKIDNLLARPV